MDLTRLQDLKFGLYTKMWTGCLLFLAILTNPAQDIYPYSFCHPAHTPSLELC